MHTLPITGTLQGRPQSEVRRFQVVRGGQAVDGQPGPDHVEMEFGPFQDVGGAGQMPQLRVQSGLAGLLHGVLEGADGGRIARVGRHIRPGQVRPDAADDDGSLTFRRGGLPHQLRPVLQPGSAAAEPAVQFQMDVRRPAQPAGGTGHDRQLLRASQETSTSCSTASPMAALDAVAR